MFKSLANSIGTHTHQVSPATGHGLCKTLAKAWEPGDMPRRKRTTFYETAGFWRSLRSPIFHIHLGFVEKHFYIIHLHCRAASGSHVQKHVSIGLSLATLALRCYLNNINLEIVGPRSLDNSQVILFCGARMCSARVPASLPTGQQTAPFGARHQSPGRPPESHHKRAA